MRILLLVFSLLCTPLFHAAAQISVEIVLDELEYLRDESLLVKVRIANRSGQPLQLGHTNDWLTFNVQSHDGYTVEKTSEVPVAGVFTVDSSQTATKTVNLMPHFSFPQPGRYSVSATVRVPQWSDDFMSARKSFHVTRGVRLWDQEFGVPKEKGAPELRRYALVQTTGMKKTRLYARVTDADDNTVFRVVPLGQIVSFSKPEAQVDRLSRLHVLFQNGARSFFYGTFDPDGEWVARQTFDYTQSRPALRVNDSGTVLVAGGLRRFTETDLPPVYNNGPREFTNSAAPFVTNPPPAVSPKPGKNDKRKKS